MEPPETYRRRAATAEAAAQKARDEEAKKILRAVSRRWELLAELAERAKRRSAGPEA
jgi:hypothetical protein